MVNIPSLPQTNLRGDCIAVVVRQLLILDDFEEQVCFRFDVSRKEVEIVLVAEFAKSCCCRFDSVGICKLITVSKRSTWRDIETHLDRTKS